MPRERGTAWLVRAAAIVIILAGLKLSSPLVVPLLLAVFIAIVTAPLVFALMARGVQRYLAVTVGVFADVAFFAAIAALGASSMNAFVAALPRYQERIGVLIYEARMWFEGQGLQGVGDVLPRVVDYEAIGNAAASGLASFAGVVSMLVLVLLVVAFILVEVVGIEGKLRFVFDDPEAGLQRFRLATAHVQKYILVKTGANLLTGVLVWGWLAAWRVDFALLWGMSAFLFNYIPTLGSAILGVPVLLITLMQYGVGACVVVGVGYGAINMAIAALVEPRVFGQALGLSPLVVFLSMVCWGWLWGPVGALLSVPLTMVVKISAAYVDGGHWVSALLGPVEDIEAGRVSHAPSMMPPATATMPPAGSIPPGAPLPADED